METLGDSRSVSKIRMAVGWRNLKEVRLLVWLRISRCISKVVYSQSAG